MADNIDCYSGLSYYGLSWSLFYFMARGLYGYDNTIEVPEGDEVKPHLAEELPEISDDGMTYTVKLREGLTFPDGRPVTSADVKATYEYMLDPNIQCATSGPPSSGYYDVIEGYDEFSAALEADPTADADLAGITTVDDLTTQFQLSQPAGHFLYALAMGWSFIRPADTPHQVLETPPPFVGPYKITNYELDQSLTIDREPTWEQNVEAGVPEEPDENNIDGIDMTIGVSEENQQANLENNEIDIAFDNAAPLGSDIPRVAQDPELSERFWSVPDARVDYLAFRTDKPPFDNVDLRKAVNYALDRDNLVRIYGGELNASSWTQFIPENLIGDEEGLTHERDLDEARRLIEESGVETPIPIKFVHFADPPGPAVGAAVKEALEEVGFQVELQGLGSDVHYGVLADETADHHLAQAGWGQDYSDAITYFVPLLGCPDGEPSGSNYAFYCNEELQAEIEEIAALEVGDERAQRWAELSTKVTEEHVPQASMFNRRHVSFISERLGNFIWGPGKQFYFAKYFIRE
jgi:ABC-type transport system substrate-binding protein